MKTTITVTQADIDKGTVCNGNGCPVALAVRRLIPLDNVSAFGDAVSGPHRINLGVDAQCFIKRFDACYKMEPFTFEADIPEELLGK